MGNFGRDDRSGGGYRGGGGGFSRGGGRGGFGGGRSSFGGGRGGDRPMFTATCSECGKECQVPFRPTNGKPVYCSECFEKKGGGSETRRFDDRPRSFQPQSQPQAGMDLNSINAKLDRIIKLLEPKVEAPVTQKVEILPEPKVEKIAEKVDIQKIKKAVKKVAKK